MEICPVSKVRPGIIWNRVMLSIVCCPNQATNYPQLSPTTKEIVIVHKSNYQPSAQACAPQLCYTAICDAYILFLFFKTPWTDTQTVMLQTWPGNSTLWITHCIIKVWAILNIICTFFFILIWIQIDCCYFVSAYCTCILYMTRIQHNIFL